MNLDIKILKKLPWQAPRLFVPPPHLYTVICEVVPNVDPNGPRRLAEGQKSYVFHVHFFLNMQV